MFEFNSSWVFLIVRPSFMRIHSQTEELQERFISCLPCDETFNRVKSQNAKGQNTRMASSSIMVNTMDNGIFNALNHFDTVDRSDIKEVRQPTLPADLFNAPLRVSKLPKEIGDLGLQKIVGTGEASWYSPSAEKMNKPLAEVVALRLCDTENENKLNEFQFAWLGRLCLKNMFVRKIGTIDWKLVIGDLFGTLVKVWPVANHHGLWVPVVNEDTVAESIVVTDHKEYEAVMVQPISPMHFAIKKEQGPCAPIEKLVDLQGAHVYDEPIICIKMITNERPLLEAACRDGFGTLQVILGYTGRTLIWPAS